MKKENKMSIEDHVETAKDVIEIKNRLLKIFNRCQEHFYKTHTLMRILYKINPYVLVRNDFMTLQSKLDDEYLEIVTDKEFSTHGYIYYE